jgi:hypothetical protein
MKGAVGMIKRGILLLLVGLLLTGCGNLAFWRQKPKAQEPAPVAIKEPPTVNNRTFLPSGPVEWETTFNDGTPPQTEAALPAQETLVGTQGGHAYVTWHLRPDGVYRRDVKSGMFLRYLPAELVDGMAWTQKVDSDVHWFLVTACPTGDCWELQVLTRNLVQRFTWAPGKWVTKAEFQDLENPKNSFQKALSGDPAPSKQTATPEAWEDGKTPPVIASNRQLFEAELQRRLAARKAS